MTVHRRLCYPHRTPAAVIYGAGATGRTVTGRGSASLGPGRHGPERHDMVIWKLAPGRGCPAPDIGLVRDATIAGLESIKERGRILGRYRSLYLSRDRVKSKRVRLSVAAPAQRRPQAPRGVPAQSNPACAGTFRCAGTPRAVRGNARAYASIWAGGPPMLVGMGARP